MKTYNKRLEEKLEARDIQINQLLSDVKILTTIFVEQKTKMDQMEIEVIFYTILYKQCFFGLGFLQETTNLENRNAPAGVGFDESLAPLLFLCVWTIWIDRV